ncbi:MAG: hypothetical protein ACKO6M_01635, partial [Bacteroidota bacterium]
MIGVNNVMIGVNNVMIGVNNAKSRSSIIYLRLMILGALLTPIFLPALPAVVLEAPPSNQPVKA